MVSKWIVFVFPKSNSMHVKMMFMKEWYMFTYQELLVRCTSMGKGMGLCLCIAHVYLDRIVLVLVSICMNMHVWTSVTYVLCERFAHIYEHTHMYVDLVKRGTWMVYSCVP